MTLPAGSPPDAAVAAISRARPRRSSTAASTPTRARCRRRSPALGVPLMGGDGIVTPDYVTAGGRNGDLGTSVGPPTEALPGAKTFMDAYRAAGYREGYGQYGAFSFDATNVVDQGHGDGARPRWRRVVGRPAAGRGPAAQPTTATASQGPSRSTASATSGPMRSRCISLVGGVGFPIAPSPEVRCGPTRPAPALRADSGRTDTRTTTVPARDLGLSFPPDRTSLESSPVALREPSNGG